MLYIVATPIGNLEDITIRALKILRKADYIFAEDTRNIKKLLNRYKIKNKKINSLHKFNENQRLKKIFQLLEKNMDVAILSDAGTPLVSDPGISVVKECFKNGIKVIPVPGVSALTALLSVTPFENKEFIFVGFLEKKQGKKTLQLKNLLKLNKNIFFFESPNRVIETLEIIKSIKSDIYIIVGREITKVYEEILFDTVENLIKYFNEKPPIGEFTFGIFNNLKTEESDRYLTDIEILKKAGAENRTIIQFIKEKYKISKNKVYEILKNG